MIKLPNSEKVTETNLIWESQFFLHCDRHESGSGFLSLARVISLSFVAMQERARARYLTIDLFFEFNRSFVHPCVKVNFFRTDLVFKFVSTKARSFVVLLLCR